MILINTKGFKGELVTETKKNRRRKHNLFSQRSGSQGLFEKLEATLTRRVCVYIYRI